MSFMNLSVYLCPHLSLDTEMHCPIHLCTVAATKKWPQYDCQSLKGGKRMGAKRNELAATHLSIWTLE